MGKTSRFLPQKLDGNVARFVFRRNVQRFLTGWPANLRPPRLVWPHRDIIPFGVCQRVFRAVHARARENRIPTSQNFEGFHFQNRRPKANAKTVVFFFKHPFDLGFHAIFAQTRIAAVKLVHIAVFQPQREISALQIDVMYGSFQFFGLLFHVCTPPFFLVHDLRCKAPAATPTRPGPTTGQSTTRPFGPRRCFFALRRCFLTRVFRQMDTAPRKQRAPPLSDILTIRCRLQYPDGQTFIAKYGVNVSADSIFIAMQEPSPVGRQVRFELLIADGQSILRGEGDVTCRYSFDPHRPLDPCGMTVRFRRLDQNGITLVRRVLAFRADFSGVTAEDPTLETAAQNTAAHNAAAETETAARPSSSTPKLLDEQLAELLKPSVPSSVTPMEVKDKLQDLLDRRLRLTKS